MDKLGNIDLLETGIDSSDLFSPELIEKALDLARKSPRKRAIIRIHEKLSDENHLMINAILGDSYVPPHKHENKETTEIFRIIKGQGKVVFYDDQGAIEKEIIISAETDGRKVVAVRPGKWHTFIPMTPETVILEAKRQPKGGYDPERDKVMAPWTGLDSAQK